MRKRAVLAGILIIALAGCATFSSRPWSERTPKEKSSYFMAFYVRQYDDTMAMAISPTITEEQKEIVRVKKSILEKLYPAIQAYDAIVAGGGIPTFANEQEILDLINRLAVAGG